MKKASILWIVLLMVSTLTMAQGNAKKGNKQVDPKARAEQMTERMAKEYTLSDSQKEELLKVNMAWGEKLKANNVGRKQGKNQQARKKSCEAAKCCCSAKKDKKNAPKMSAEARKALKESRDAYQAQVKDIMSKEQYERYVSSQKKRK